MKIKCLILLGTILLFVLAGCRQQSESFDEILSVYEKMTEGEDAIRLNMQQKNDLREEERELRGLIIEGGEDSNLAVMPYIEEMIESIRSRETLMEEMVRIMEETKEELEAATLLIESIQDQRVRESFLEVQNLHRERYDAFIEWSNHYLETTREEIRFYNLLQEEEQSLQELESITIELNQRGTVEGELQEALTQVSIRLNDAIGELARALEG